MFGSCLNIANGVKHLKEVNLGSNLKIMQHKGIPTRTLDVLTT